MYTHTYNESKKYSYKEIFYKKILFVENKH